MYLFIYNNYVEKKIIIVINGLPFAFFPKKKEIVIYNAAGSVMDRYHCEIFEQEPGSYKCFAYMKEKAD